jgi:hypothetical protein
VKTCTKWKWAIGNREEGVRSKEFRIQNYELKKKKRNFTAKGGKVAKVIVWVSFDNKERFPLGSRGNDNLGKEHCSHNLHE